MHVLGFRAGGVHMLQALRAIPYTRSQIGSSVRDQSQGKKLVVFPAHPTLIPRWAIEVGLLGDDATLRNP